MNKVTFIAVFLLGCATTKLVEYVSFNDAVAKTGSNCQYTMTGSGLGVFGETDDSDKKPVIKYASQVKMLISQNWRVHTMASPYFLWEKCE